ncbi:MAG: hypothetical protein EAX86_03390 [Candidatus Heimdallarchaeota archaeon]|nr:hypothetical protein [Candidatus Heimdallarchaeota archaeon]
MNSKVLVIGEKPSQVKTIAQAIFSTSSLEKSADYIYIRKGVLNGKKLELLPLVGHITSIDTTSEYNWGKCEPLEIVKSNKSLIINENEVFQKLISQKAKIASELWLATDPDSEGDNIALEAYRIATRVNPSLKKNTSRIWNSSLTQTEILRAFNDLKKWDQALAIAVEGRRFVDAWVGFAGTREVTKAARQIQLQKGKGVLSVGRVQLPTLKLIIDRDRERIEFQYTDKHNLFADILDDSRNKVILSVKHLGSPFSDIKELNKILIRIEGSRTGLVKDFSTRVTKIPPPRPLNTTDALGILTKELKVKAESALNLLTDLYEEGFISYPRTENRRFKDNFPHVPILEKLSKHSPFKDFLLKIDNPTQVRVNGRKIGVEDHDPIHPTGNIPKNSQKITELHIKSWDYISRYYIGMFMPDLIQERGQVLILIKEERFGQEYQQTTNKGWVESIYWRKPKETSKFGFLIDQIVQIGNLRKLKFKTSPPPRWSDAALLKRLELLKIGTKSSRPDIIKKLEVRGYIHRDKTSLESTQLGVSIIQVLETIWPDLVTPNFTRMVEQKMDEVASHQASYEDMLESIRKEYIQLHERLIAHIPELKAVLTNPKLNSSSINQANICPACGSGIVVERRNSKTGEIFYGCNRFPECKWTKSLNTSVPKEVTILNDIVGPCPKCNGNLILKKVKIYKIVGCTNYPTCKTSYFLPKKGRLYLLKKKCPKCNRRVFNYINSNKKTEKYVKTTICAICGKIPSNKLI